MNLYNEDQIYKRNMGLLALIYVPLVLLSKLVRWTIMRPQLVDMSIGWKMVDIISINSDESFRGSDNVVSLFRSINFAGLDTYIEWEWFITIGWNVIIFLFIVDLYRKNKTLGMFDNLFIYLNIAILNIFCFNMSKEPGQMLYFVLMALAIKSFNDAKMRYTMTCAAILATTIFMRRYYAIVLIYFVIVTFFIETIFSKIDVKSRGGAKKIFFMIILMFVFFSLCHFGLLSIMSIIDPGTYLEMIRVNNREGAPAVSEIAPIFGTTNRALFTVDYFIKIFRLMFPIELLLKGKVTYIFIVAYHTMLFSYLYRSFMNFRSQCDIKKSAIYLYVAFWLCSASFEPDFGSWTRHEGVAFPVIIMLLYSNKKDINEKTKDSILCR